MLHAVDDAENIPLDEDGLSAEAVELAKFKIDGMLACTSVFSSAAAANFLTTEPLSSTLQVLGRRLHRTFLRSDSVKVHLFL
jgi:hypothetical protein